jgi:acetolactate synthase-1/2/3 large subunit
MGSAADNSLASETESPYSACDLAHTPKAKPALSRVADVITDYLSLIGVKHIFGVGGANIEDVYDAAFFNDELTAVLAKHEFSAATMADGYSRSGIGLGVVAATSGGASLNLVPGLGESLASRVPVLALIGQPPTTMDGQGSFQDTSGSNGALNAEALFTSVSLHCERILEPADIATALPRAVAAARSGGPAVLLLPKDVQQSVVDLAARDMPVVDNRVAADDPGELAAELRKATGQVTIIAGEQVSRDDAREELERLRAALDARLATVPDAKDAIGFARSSALIGVTGVMGHPGVASALLQGTLCLLIGTRLPATARSGLEDALALVPTLSVGSVPPFVPCRHLHSDDLRGTLPRLTAALERQGSTSRWSSESPLRQLAPPNHRGPGVRYGDAMAILDDLLPDGADVVVDAGNSGAAAVHQLPARPAGRFIIALGMGGMGYSFGAGIGLAFARGRRTVVIAGDGAFFMHGMEIHTAVEYGLPITFVLFNNNAHAMCVTREQLFYDDRYSYNRFRPSRIGAGLAAMFPDLPSRDVESLDALPEALREALRVDGPSVVSIECSADEIPPFAPFLNNIATKETKPDVAASA